MRIKADALGLLAEDYETDRILIKDLYTGTIEVSVSAEKMAAFRAAGQLELNGGRQYLPNEYCTLMEMLGDLNMGHEHHRSANLMRSGSIVIYIRGRSSKPRRSSPGWATAPRSSSPAIPTRQVRMSRAFSAPDGFWEYEPRALPWAGMKRAVGPEQCQRPHAPTPPRSRPFPLSGLGIPRPFA
ncbi:MAG: hypothetical protein WCL11_02335 [Verrucomicrobiota bacterium]